MRTDPTFCCGWRSIWCVLDKLLGCHVKLICDRHDASIWRLAGGEARIEAIHTPPSVADIERYRSVRAEGTES